MPPSCRAQGWETIPFGEPFPSCGTGLDLEVFPLFPKSRREPRETGEAAGSCWGLLWSEREKSHLDPARSRSDSSAAVRGTGIGGTHDPSNPRTSLPFPNKPREKPDPIGFIFLSVRSEAPTPTPSILTPAALPEFSFPHSRVPPCPSSHAFPVTPKDLLIPHKSPPRPRSGRL